MLLSDRCHNDLIILSLVLASIKETHATLYVAEYFGKRVRVSSTL